MGVNANIKHSIIRSTIMDKKELHIIWGIFAKQQSGEASVEEISKLNDWLAMNDENQKQLEYFKKVLSANRNFKLVTSVNVEQALKRVKSHNKEVKTFSFKIFIRVAAVVLITFGIGFLAKQHHFKHQYVTVETHAKQVLSKTLPDGSFITLNENSKISYHKKFGHKTRKIEMQGEAYFEVAKNKQVPFIIDANKAKVTVLGTSFNVSNRNPKKVNVMVKEGKVKFESNLLFNKNSCLLTGGEEAYFDLNTKKVIKSQSDNENTIGWKTNTLKFKNVNLLDAVKTIEHSYHVSINVDEALHSKKLTASYTNQPIDSIARILELTLDVDISKSTNSIYHITPN